ncbi:MAG: N-6 DNA methylase, partial [Bacteroidales bacterium]|nr:N-6 DNA methylase [Bacteroidales bacterium]
MEGTVLVKGLGFVPKENALGIFIKKYSDGYCIEVDCAKSKINYGEKIQSDARTTQNFSQLENFVVLECVNRLLEKGYKPENIILEKTWSAGHGTSGRLDICVNRDDGSEYLLIECKTHGGEFDKEFARMKKDGGQLFTYFKFSNKADVIMLYASELKGKEIVYRNEIIKIEDDYRTGDVKDFYNKWDKQVFDKGIFEKECEPYNLQPKKKITILDLEELTADKGQTLFNQFAEILRRHSVSDKPNAFSVIFNLFLAKIWDEHKAEDEELEFQWNENDDAVDFQVTLHNLHKEGLKEFLKKEMDGICNGIFTGDKSAEEIREAKKKFLKINSVFAIKNVIDDADFERNHRVLVEVVKMLQKYRIKYPRKQKYLSEFFERLLTVGLKQEVGQYFTPPPITKFIVKSLPLPEMIKQTTKDKVAKLPAVIDYAAGSGHFLTEIMEEYQNIIDELDTNGYSAKAKNEVDAWKINQYSWAGTYVYGIEKDYRLVKVAKIGCYFYGDGLAQVIYGDGLDSFKKSEDYRGLLKENAQEPQFSIVVSNPPYAVNDCKDDLEYLGAQNDFDIYKSLTYSSKEIECLFVERTKHLLKDDGIASIVLPSSILSNTGIYTKTREIILQYFDIVAITELGSNTFMATGTNTVVLFLRKRNEAKINDIKERVYNLAKNYPKTQEDLTLNGIEKPVKKYLDYTGESEIDLEKFYYFVLNYWQKTVLIKTGEKDAEKRFLGYEYSNRRGHEGMHSIQRGKTIEECTKLFNENDFKDETKANSYIYRAFNDNFDYPIHESLKDNIFRMRLVNMLAFDRQKFEKIISTAVKKKVKIESKW